MTKCWVAIVLTAASVGPQSLRAQVVPPGAVAEFQEIVGNRVELVTVLGGNYAAGGGLYTFRGGTLSDVSVSKFGGGGDIAEPKPLGNGGIQWSPVLLGNVGYLTTENEFRTGFVQGNASRNEAIAVQAGGGVRLHFTDHFSISPTFSGIYGHTRNEFVARNANGQALKALAGGEYVDWDVDTWSVVPAMELRYVWPWRRTTFEFTTRYNFFHTESFHSTSPLIDINGNSHTWANRLDVDVPLGLRVFGHELHTGGFFQRSDVFGGVADGLRSDYVYVANGRLVLDFLGHIWMVRWVGLGASYVWGEQFDGWTAGIDFRFEF